MSDVVVGGFFVFTFFGVAALIYLFLHMRGSIISLWIRPVSCFPHVKSNRPMRIRITSEPVHTLSPILREIFDTTTESLGKTKEGKELKKAWEKIKANPNNFTIWSIGFNKRWTVAGETGKTVFMYSLFSPEEMIHRLGRKKLIKAILLYPPHHIHHPVPKKDWIQLRIEEAKNNGLQITPELRKTIEKNYRSTSKEHWISFILYPTMLSEVEETTLVERLVGFENLFKISVNAMKEFATKIAKFAVYENAVANFEKMKRELQIQIHNMDASNQLMARQKQDMQHTINRYSLKMKVSSGGEPYPTVSQRKTKEEKGSVTEIKTTLKNMDYTEVFLAVMAILGFMFVIFGGFATLASIEFLPILMCGVVMAFCGVGIYLWKKRNEPQTKTIKKQGPLEIA